MSSKMTNFYRVAPVDMILHSKWFLDCRCPKRLLASGVFLKKRVNEIITSAGFSVRNQCHTNFRGGGTTILFALAESHLVLNTWPEKNLSVHVELAVCNRNRDNTDRVGRMFSLLINLFKPTQVRSSYQADNMVTEYRLPGYGYFLTVDKEIVREHTGIQFIQIFQNQTFGNVMCLDGLYQTSEMDEWSYHEPLVHVPALLHKNPLFVLVIGGGDGGAAKHVLWHSSVKKCTVVDIDPKVVDYSKQFLKHVHCNVWDDPRMVVKIADGQEFLDKSKAVFDLVIIDLTDPIGHAKPLFKKQFYNKVAASLVQGGMVSTHCGFPLSDPKATKVILSELKSIFPYVLPYYAYVPIYGAEMLFCVCSIRPLSVNRSQITTRLSQRGLNSKLRSLNAGNFCGRFALPTWMETVISK
jgi:spermidine synthase